MKIRSFLFFLTAIISLLIYISYDLNNTDVVKHERKRKKDTVYYLNIGYQSKDLSINHKAAHLFDLIESNPNYYIYGIRYQLSKHEIKDLRYNIKIIENLFFYDIEDKTLIHQIDDKQIIRHIWHNIQLHHIKTAIDDPVVLGKPKTIKL